MRVLIAVEGTRGDVYPMLALARTLLACGHAVRICAPPDFADDARAAGASFSSLGTPVRAFLEETAAAVHGGTVPMLRAMARFGDLSVASQFRVLPEAAAGCDAVIGAGTILAGASAAELHDVPYTAVLYTPAVVPSAEHTPCILPVQLRTRWINRALWRAAAMALDATLRRALDRERRSLGLAPVRDAVSHVLSRRPVLAADRPVATWPADAARGGRQIRCLHPLDGAPLPPKVESFLEQGPAPVYLGFGSMPDPDPAATTRRLVAATTALGCRAILSRGWAGLGDGPLPDGVLVIDPVDHASLFPRMAAVVHHGGAGTTHTAARAGVPQLIVPHVLDQFYFARRVVDLGVGVATPAPRRVDVDRLVATLGALLDAEHVADRARSLAEELAGLGPVEPELASLLDA